MKPRYCTVPHNPPHSYGDCFRACVATILDRDDIPHFFSNPDEDGSGVRKWLKDNGRNIAWFAFDNFDDRFMSLNATDVMYLLIGKTQYGQHCVVGSNDTIIHDPIVGGGGQLQPTDEGHFIVGLLC